MEENNTSQDFTLNKQTISSFCFKLYTIVLGIFLDFIGFMVGVFLFKTTEEKNKFIILCFKTICLKWIIICVIIFTCIMYSYFA